MNLSKSKYVTGLQCPKILWMDMNMPEQFDDSVRDEARMEVGLQVGVVARGYFGSYEEVPYSPDKAAMIAETQRLIVGGSDVIAEASFSFNGNFCSVDILRKTARGYELIEVKGSTGYADDSPDKIKEDYIDDMAYQFYVLSNSGLRPKKVSVMRLNKEYVRQGELDIQSLFTLTDCTEQAINKQASIPENIAHIKGVAGQSDEPDFEISTGCMDCGYKGWCMRKLPEHNVFAIKWRLSSRIKNEAYSNGIVSFQDVLNGGVMLNEKQRRQVETVVNNLSPHINKAAIRSFLSRVKYPLYHLDFETYQQAIPLWDDVSPYNQIPFQYSLHIQDKPCGETVHKEFLGKEGVDPRRELSERLINDIPADACVMAYYMSFEKSQIRGLAGLFPDLSNHLMSIHDNMIDLAEPFGSGAYYCRGMGGSFSIKFVLPAMCPGDPELDYGSLKLVQSGGDAMTAYATLHEKSPEEISEIRAALLAYCKLDTLAMVKILEKLYEVVE